MASQYYYRYEVYSMMFYGVDEIEQVPAYTMTDYVFFFYLFFV